MKNKPDQSFCNDDLKERVPDGHKKFGNKGLNVPVCTVEVKKDISVLPKPSNWTRIIGRKITDYNTVRILEDWPEVGEAVQT